MRKIILIFVVLLVLGSVFISGCIQGQQGQNTTSNNSTINNTTGNNSTQESPEQTLGGEQSENNKNNSEASG